MEGNYFLSFETNIQAVTVDGILILQLVMTGLHFLCHWSELAVWYHCKAINTFLQLKLHKWEGQDKQSEGMEGFLFHHLSKSTLKRVF